MSFTTLFLSRLQFAFVVAFHIVFPTMSIGLAAFLTLVEFLHLRTRDELYVRIYRFWATIFALGFSVGVVTGIVMAFQFGTNFSRFAKLVGPVIGPLIGLEVLTAFFLEAGFLGIMLFGWGRVGPKLHFLATFCVSLGTTISASWIMAVNSWMQTPSGIIFRNGRVVVVSWWHVVFSPSYPYRLVHMLLGAWITTSFLVAGVAAFYLVRQRHLDFARACFSLALGVASILLPLQLYLGDRVAIDVDVPYQPAKVQAMEGFWDTTTTAPYHLIIITDQEHQRNRFELGIPYVGSIWVTQTLHGAVPGLKETRPDLQPTMWIVFYSFRLMLASGITMFCVAMYSVWLRYRRRLYISPGYQRIVWYLAPIGFLAILGGWITAETGRQPWVVYNIMRTANAVSPIPREGVLVSLISFVVVYAIILSGFLFLALKAIRRGPGEQPLVNHPTGTVRRVFLPASAKGD